MSTTGIGGTPLSAVEVALTYGGDYQLTASGDLMLVQDTPFYPYATIQRITFLILTNPAMPNVENTAIGVPDDIFYPKYGAGSRAFVGRSNSASSVNIDALQRNILDALAKDQFISQSPRPSVTFSSLDGFISSVLCTIRFVTKSGQNVTITDIQVGGPS